VRDLLPAPGAERLEGGLGGGFPLRGFRHAGEDDLVVGDEGSDERLALGCDERGHLADLPPLGIDLEDAPRPEVDLEVLEGLLLEDGPEAYLGEGDPAVVVPSAIWSPARVRRAAVTVAPSSPGPSAHGAARRPRAGRRRRSRRG